MKKSTRIWNWLSFLFSVIFVIFAFIGQAQTCSVPLEVINAKYWEYKENFNKHFILIDRDPSGCVRDGIGQQSGNLCEFSKAGYSLPATSINMAPNGGYGMKDRNKGDDPETPEWLEDTDCAEAGPDPGTSYEPGANKHNYLDVGSETPQQLGWYWVTLATEYELLRRNGQLDEAQRTLEELFLALQAYRRLDMQAQCMAKKRYDEITDDFEVENCDFISTPFDCLCGKKYWGKDEVHSSFGVPCYDNCIWQPDLSGYSGFFLREDATQGLEALHDLSEDQYNIDLVSSDYAMSLSPPCLTTFSQPCYLAHRQNYMSQDQLVGLMIGLTIIKKYIPENAEVTTCEGVKFKPLEMAKKISNALVDRLDDTHNNKIFFPGSDECCLKRAVFSNAEGGQAMAIIHGLKKAADYIDDHDRHSNVDEYFAWSIGLRGVVQLSYSAEGNFWLKLKALGWDMGEERNATKTLFNSAVQTQGQEILTLINNLLYPGGENLSTDQSFFAEMLCSAPCGGPCIRREPYEGESSSNWPIFNCSNHPDWRGQRWENNRAAKTPNRLFNGLDFMALYNIYLLHYNQVPEDYFNPAGAEGAGKSFYADKISGPSVLCKDQTAYYEAQQIVGAPTSSGPSHWFEEIHWTSSSNFNILTPNTNGTDIEATADANPSYIEAKLWRPATFLNIGLMEPFNILQMKPVLFILNVTPLMIALSSLENLLQ